MSDRFAARWRGSLRLRFTLLAVAAVALAVVGVAVASWLVVSAKLNRQFDDQLRSYTELAARSDSARQALATLRSTARETGEPFGHGDLVVRFVSATGEVETVGAEQDLHISVEPSAQVQDYRVGHDHYRVWSLARDGGWVQVASNSDEIEQTLEELTLLHAAIGTAGVLAAAGVGFTVAWVALRPVDRLTAAAARVAATQELTGIPVRGRGEIARLTEAFNTMLAALEGSRTAQRRLVEDAGHELRTPLTSLRNNIELLLHAESHPERVVPATDRSRLLAELGTQVVELSTLVAEVVELAKDPATDTVAVPVNLGEVVSATVDRARARGTTVRFTVTVVPAPVVGDPRALERAVLNLIDNAVKWSPDGAEVRVSVAVEDGQAVVEVTDMGPGIAEADLPHVFERFYRAEAARALPGSGLGLAIVEQVATAHGGTASAGRGSAGGARLWIRLPLAG